MLFDYAKVFCYDAQRLKKFTFKEVVDIYDRRPNEVPNGFSLSGLSDLMTTMSIIEEYYLKNFPVLDWKELRKGSGVNPTKIDMLYHEPASLKKEYSRVIRIPTFISQDDKETKLGKQGAQITQTVEFSTGVINLYRADYYPEIGDEIVWMGELYQIGEVLVRKDHYHANTGMPLHVTLKTINVQYGDEQMPTTLTDKNQVVYTAPDDRYSGAKKQLIGYKIPVIK